MNIRPRQIKMVLRIPRRIALRRHPLRLTVPQRLRRDTLLFLQLQRGFHHRDGQARSDVPLHVAMQDPDTRVVGAEAHHRVAAGRDHHGVALHGDGGEGGLRAVVGEGGVRAHVLGAGEVDAGVAGDELHNVAVHV